MAFDRVGLSSEGCSVLSTLKSRDFNVSVRAILIDVKLSLSELTRLTVSSLSKYTCTELSTVSSLGTEINVVAKGLSELPKGSETYPSGYSVALLVTSQNGTEVCLVGASCDESFVADSRLIIRFGIEETNNMFRATVDFDGDVTYGILSSEIDSVRSSIPTRTSHLVDDVPFVTVATDQTITGNKGITGTLSLKSHADPDNVYTSIHTTSSSTSSPQVVAQFVDMSHSVVGTTSFHSSRNGSNQYFYSTIRKYDANNDWSVIGGVLTMAYIGDHYHTISDDYLICFPGEENFDSAVVGSFHEAARILNDFNASSSETSRQKLAVYDKDDDYKERIRLRRVEYTANVGSVPEGTVRTYLELFANTVTNVAEEVHFQYTEIGTITHPLWDETEQSIVQVSHQGPVAHDLLVISKTGGVYSTQFSGGYKIGNTSYAFGTAGSLTYETALTSKADNQHIPTSYAVKSYVDSVTGNIPPSDLSGYLTNEVASQTYQPIGDYALQSDIKNTTLTIQKNGTTVSTFTANSSTDVTANISVPTTVAELTDALNYALKTDLPIKTSDLMNDSGFLTQHQDISGKADKNEVVASGEYDSQTHTIKLKNNAGTVLSSVDATAFIKDGMVDTVSVTSGNLLITFNTDSGKENIEIPITSIFNASNYYTKTEIDNAGYLTQHQSLSDYALKTDINNATLTIKRNASDTGTVFTANASNDVTANLDLSEVAVSGSYYDLTDKPSIPSAANNATLTIQKNGTTVITFSADASENVMANITVPTTVAELSDASSYALSADLPESVSDLENDLGFLTSQDVSDVAMSGSYNDLSNTPSIPAAANNATLTLQKNGSSVGTFTADASSDVTVNLLIPTQVSDLTNDIGFITSSSLPTNYVTTDTAQTVIGNKTFTGSVVFDDGVTGFPEENTEKKSVTAQYGTLSFTHYDASACAGRYLLYTTRAQVGLDSNAFYISFPQVERSGTTEVYSGDVVIGDQVTTSLTVSGSGDFVDIQTSNLTLPKGSETWLHDEAGYGVTDLHNYALRRGAEFVIGTQSSATSSWTGEVTQVSLYEGMMVNYYLPYAGSTSSATLNLTFPDGTTTGAIPVRRLGNGINKVTTQYPANTVIPLILLKDRKVVSSSQYTWVVADYSVTDSDQIDRTRMTAAVRAGTNGIYGHTLILRTGEGVYESLVLSSSNSSTSKTPNTNGFYLDEIYAYNDPSDVSSGSLTAMNTIYAILNVDVRYNINEAFLTNSCPVYLVGTFSNGKFYLDTTWWTQSLPTTDDGKYYVFLGIMSSTYEMHLWNTHPIYYYADGRIRQISVAELDSTSTLAKNYVGLVEYDDPVDNGGAYITRSPNLIMMTSNGKWFPVINKTTKTANALSGQTGEFSVHLPILVDLNTEGSTGTPNAFATHPNVRLHDFLAYMNGTDPEDLSAGEVTRDQNEKVLYRTSALDLYIVSCDPTRYSDLQTMLTNALNAYVSEGGTLSGTVASEVSDIMDDVQSLALPRKICSNYTSGTFDALRNGMYTYHPCDGYIDEDLYAHFTSYRQGCPIWLQGGIREDGTFWPYKVDHALSSYGILLGFETEFGKLNFQPDNGLYKSIRVNDSVQIQRVTWPTVSDTLHFPNGTLHNVGSSLLTSSMSISAPSFVGNVIGGIPYGSCTTAANTATKEVTLSPDPEFLREGMLICVRFSYTNSASSPTLKINGTGYYGSPLLIYRSGTSSGNTAYTSWSAGEELLLRYDGVKWVMVGTPSSVQSANYALQLNNNRTLDGVIFNNTASITHYATCTTDATTATKVVTLAGFVLDTGARIAVKFANSNSASSPMLNVSNGSSYTGAKAIKFGDDVSVGTDNYSKWQAGDIVEFIYDGTYWVMVGFQVYASYASQATRATGDGSGNTISTYYCTLTTDQTISGNKTFSGTTHATGSLYVTGYSSGGMRFSDSTAMQETDYVRFRGNCGSSSYSGIDFQFYVNSSLSNTISFKDDETDLTTIPSVSNTWSIGSNTKTLKAVYATTFNGNATSATKATQDANGDTISSSYASELRTYTRPSSSSSTTYGSTSSTYLSLYSKSNNLLSRAYISDIVANALRGYGGFGYGSATVTSSSAGYRTYSSFGSVGSLGLFAVSRTSSDTSSISPGNSISGTSLTRHAIPYRKNTGVMSLSTISVTLSGTWYLLNYLYAYSSSYAQDYQMVLAVRVL